jgi:DNA topoisomerase-1
MSPAQWNATDAAIVAKTPAGDAVFKATGRQLVFDGYLKVAGRARAEEPVLPALQAGQPVAAVTLDATQHFTQPPPRYTEASLVKALEAEGIGRPSTYASIIQTIQDRQYVQQNERKFSATELGSKVVDKLVKHFPDIFDLRFTARMEDRLDDIEGGQAGWIKVLHDFYGPFKADLERAAEEMVHAKAESEPSDYRCPACDKPMVYRWSKNGRYLACTGYPECKTTFPVDAEGKKLERVEVNTPCPKCGKKMVLRRSRFGPFLGCSDYPACKGTLPCDKDGQPLKLVKEEDIKETCPDCRAPMAVKRRGRRAFLGCSRYPDCKATASLPEGIRLAGPPREKPVEAGVKCPKCGKPMVIRNGRRGGFVACSGYPRCRHTFDISKLEEMRKLPSTS